MTDRTQCFQRSRPRHRPRLPVAASVLDGRKTEYVLECLQAHGFRQLADLRVRTSFREVLRLSSLWHPADMDPICEIGERHGLFVLEDAAAALGATIAVDESVELASAPHSTFLETRSLPLGKVEWSLSMKISWPRVFGCVEGRAQIPSDATGFQSLATTTG